MQVPFTLVPFEEMNRKQAMQYLNWYIEVLDERIAYLANHVHETGGDVIFDYSPDSLISIWKWFMPRVELVPMTEKEINEEIGVIEPWMEKHIPNFGMKISSYTWRVMYDITAYCGQVIIKNIPGLYWGCVCKPKSLIGVNEPCLLGFPQKGSICLNGKVDVCRMKSMETHDDRQLYSLYELCKELKGL